MPLPVVVCTRLEYYRVLLHRWYKHKKSTKKRTHKSPTKHKIHPHINYKKRHKSLSTTQQPQQHKTTKKRQEQVRMSVGRIRVDQIFDCPTHSYFDFIFCNLNLSKFLFKQIVLKHFNSIIYLKYLGLFEFYFLN